MFYKIQSANFLQVTMATLVDKIQTNPVGTTFRYNQTLINGFE